VLKSKKSAQNHTLLRENIRNRLFSYEKIGYWICKSNWWINRLTGYGVTALHQIQHCTYIRQTFLMHSIIQNVSMCNVHISNNLGSLLCCIVNNAARTSHHINLRVFFSCPWTNVVMLSYIHWCAINRHPHAIRSINSMWTSAESIASKC